MKKIVTILLALVILVGAGIVFVPRLAHTCDDCEEFFSGTGYMPNILSDLVSKEEQIICKTCAEKQHAISIGLGKTVEDFKLPLFDEE